MSEQQEKRLTRKEYKEKIEYYRCAFHDAGILYATLLLSRHWFELTGKEKQDMKHTIQKFMHGRGYVNAYNELGLWEKVEELARIHLNE